MNVKQAGARRPPPTAPPRRPDAAVRSVELTRSAQRRELTSTPAVKLLYFVSSLLGCLMSTSNTTCKTFDRN